MLTVALTMQCVYRVTEITIIGKPTKHTVKIEFKDYPRLAVVPSRFIVLCLFYYNYNDEYKLTKSPDGDILEFSDLY